MARWIIIALLLFPNIALGGVYVSGGVDPVEIGRRIAVSSPGVITLASGSVTRANTKISAVDGTAFVDFSTADVLTNYAANKYRKLTLTDSTGKKLVGYIKAAGTGEIWEERITAQNDRDFSGGTIGNWQPYTKEAGSGHTVDYDSTLQALKITVGSTVGTYTGALLSTGHMGTFLTGGSITVGKADVYLPSGQSFTGVFYVTEGGSFAGRAMCSSIPTKLSSLVTVDEWQTDLIAHPIYAFTDVTGYLYVYWSGGVTGNVFYVKNVSFRQLVTPSTTGVTITSTPDGTTYNWASKESGFNYNDAGGYTYAITTR
jgi:hypothetical protein